MDLPWLRRAHRVTQPGSTQPLGRHPPQDLSNTKQRRPQVKEAPLCVLCGALCEPWPDGDPPGGYGNNPAPLAEDTDEHPQRCCDTCNITKVIPARLRSFRRTDGE